MSLELTSPPDHADREHQTEMHQADLSPAGMHQAEKGAKPIPAQWDGPPVKTRVRSHSDDNYAALAPLFLELADPEAGEVKKHRLRNELVLAHLPVAEHIAMRFRNRGQPEDDLRQVATVGLINAVNRFDPHRGTDFLSFAVPTITGEVRRYFRDATWAVRMPRRLQELHASIGAAAERLYKKLDRAPRPSELAAELDLNLDDVHEGLLAGYAYNSISLEDTVGAEGRGKTVERLSISDDNLNAVDDRDMLYPALAELPEREAAIVVMRFFENLTQNQIAERVGLSQMHVSRLLAASLRKLRDHIAAEPDAATA